VRPPVADAARYSENARAAVFDIAPSLARLGWSPRDCWAEIATRAVSD
jgi:hypothetical protein